MDSTTSSNGDGILADQGASDFAQVATFDGGGASAPGQQQATPQGAGAPSTPAQTTPQTPAGDAQQQTPPVTPGAVTPPTAPAVPDYSAIIKSTVDATANAMRQQQAPAAPTAPQEISPQDFDRKYGIVRPNEQMLTQILGQDPKQAVQTLDTLFQANLTAALRMSNDLVEAKLAELNGRYEPHLKSWQQHQQQQQNQAAEDAFFKANPDLVAERDLVMEMKDALLAKVQAGQVKFSTTQEAFSAVANATRSILTKVRGTGAAPQTPTGQQQSGRQMSAASSAGRTGTGQAAASKSVVDEVFGQDAR